MGVIDPYDNIFTLRTFDILHFGGLIYLMLLIVIYTMMYYIHTDI